MPQIARRNDSYYFRVAKKIEKEQTEIKRIIKIKKRR
jgi:hypothetical protein